MRSSLIFGFFCLLCIGCVRSITPEEALFRAEAHLAELDSAVGICSAKEIISYGTALTERLLANAPARSYPARFRVAVSGDASPRAYAAGGGVIVVSRGLLRKVSTEAEFAFVVAHEMAHEIRRHTLRDETQEVMLGSLHPQRSLDDEITADRLAIGYVILAGYDPRGAERVVAAAHRLNRDAAAHDHELVERLSALRSEIERYAWRPPATKDRAAYQEFRHAAHQRCR